MNKNRLFIKLSSMFLFVVVALMALAFNVSAATLGLQPTGICVSYYDDIDSRGFAWQTSTEATESKLLYIKDDGNVDWNNATVIDGNYVDFNDYRCHKAEVVDLAAGNYLYKVGGNNVYSEVGKFTIDDANDNKVSFTYVTDSQETSEAGFEYFNKTLTTAVKHNPDFIAFAGDLVDNSHADWGKDMSKVVMEEWSYAFDVTKGVTMNYPMMSASGNHESAGHTFVNHNNVKFDKELSTGGYYSFDYSNLHFVVLDTNMFESWNQAEIDAQLAWLENDLATTDKQWKVVMLHIGVYSTGDHSNDASVAQIRNMLPQIFAKYKVDLVLQGHDHVYTRTLPYYYGEEENGRVPNRDEKYVKEDGINWSQEPDGTYYITINYAGTKNYPPVDYDTSRIFPATSPINGKVMSQHVKNRMFAHVEVDGDRLLLKSYIAKDDGSEELYDYIAIQKNTHKIASDAIDALTDELTIDDTPKLKKAYDLVNALSDRGLAYMPQEKIDRLNAILEKYNLNQMVEIYDVIQTINTLNTTDYNEAFFENYTLAKQGYYNLTDAEKEKVYNKDILLGLKDKIADIENDKIQSYLVEGVQKLIDAIETAENKEVAIMKAKAAYDLLDEEAKALIKNADVLNQEAPKKKGCKGSIIGSMTAVLMLGCAIVLNRRRRGDCDEN